MGKTVAAIFCWVSDIRGSYVDSRWAAVVYTSVVLLRTVLLIGNFSVYSC